MALHGNIGQSEVSIKAIKAGNHVYELAVEGEITISRSINTASSLSCRVLRDEITIEKGDTIDFTLDGEHHQFFGIVVDTTKEDKWVDITAYDQIWYLNKNTRHISYEDITLNELLERLCTDRGYSMSDPNQFEDTVHKLPARVEENTKELQIITNAIDALYPMSQVKYFLWDDAGYLRLNSTNWLAGETSIVIQPGYFESYSLKETMDNGFSVVRLEERVTAQGGQNAQEGQDGSDTPKTEYENKTYQAIDPSTNDKYGTIEYQGTVSEGENGQAKADQLIAEVSKDFDKGELTINACQGDITVRGGTPVLVDFFTQDRQEYIRGWWETQSVTHHFDNCHHTMDLTLKELIDLNDWENTDPSYYSHWTIN